MVDFKLSREQEQLRQTAHDFSAKEIRPAARHHDETGEYPFAVLKKAWELGLVNTHIPEEYGGLGLGTFEGVLIAEENGWGCTGISTAMEANTLAEVPVIVAGTEDPRKWSR